MNDNKIVKWLKENYLFCLAILCEVLLLVGIFTNLVTTKGAVATFVDDPDWPYYAISKAHSRESLNIFQAVKEGTATPFFVLYGLGLVGCGITLLGKFTHKNFYIGASLLFLCLGVGFLTVNAFYGISLTKALLGANYNADYAWVWEDVIGVAETKLDFGSTFSAILAFASAIMCFSTASEKESLKVNDLAEMGVLSALAIGLQFIKIPIGATGGSINLGLIPLFMIALRKGPVQGFIASGLVYGLVTCLTDGYGFNTYPFDYLLGFGGCAALGFFKNLCFTKDAKGWKYAGFAWIFVGVAIASVVRFVGSSASSMINYGYTVTAAMAYNVIYVFVTGAVSLVAMLLLYIPLAKVNKIVPNK